VASRTYQNFDLLVEATPTGYHARVVNSPTGESPSIDFTLPFDATVLENLLLKLDPGRSGTRRVAQDPQVQAGRDFGGPLFDAVFAGDVALAWGRGQDAAGTAGNGVRLRLRLTDAPALAGLPWELLYDRRANAFIAQSERTPLVRYLDVPQVIRPLSVDGALRLLVVISSPTDLPELDGDAEFARVTSALADRIASGQVVVDRLPTATISALGQWLRSHDVHVLHFVGHGDFDTRQQDGVLYFCDSYGRSSAITSSVLGPFVHDHDPLRLVLLNACRSAHVDNTDPYSGMAQGLVQQDAAAVVAMQFPISDQAAVAFTGDFYGAMADGLPVDQAVTSARKTLNADFGAEWATPILFLRASDGEVFEGIAAPAAPVVVEPVPEPLVPVAPEPATPASPVPEPEPAVGPDPLRGGPPPVGPVEPVQPVQPVVPVGPDHHEGTPSPLIRWLGAAAVGAVALGLVLWLVLRPHNGTPDAHGSSTTTSTTTSTGTGTVTPPPPPPPSHTRASVPGPTVQALQFATPPTIDGTGTEWTGHPAYASNNVIAGGPTSVHATWQLGWDATNYYVFVTVVDANITQTHADEPSQVFNGDAVSFEIGVAEATARTDVLPSGDLHVLMGPTPDGQVVRAINVANGGASLERGEPFTQGHVAALITPDGYTIEAAIPWSRLKVTAAEAGLVLATNLNVSDAVPSGTARGNLAVMESNNPARKTNAASLRYRWGRLQLVGA